jgi:hypothetical protein
MEVKVDGSWDVEVSCPEDWMACPGWVSLITDDIFCQVD